jgi:type III restriction enzyme
MIQLKDYQDRVLGSLRAFLKLSAQTGHPADAFREVTEQVYGEPLTYIHATAAGLPADMPYVCLRVPTGGGKTLLACHAVGIAQTELLRAERSVVLWLVPSNTILEQTADALRDVRHPYRRALELECAGPVEVLRIDEALNLTRARVDGATVVIVATMQSFRVEDTTGRKVYAQSSPFQEHFLNLPPEDAARLFEGADKKPVPSLVNMLRLRRPVIIVDEAHNARTDLSFATLGNLLPACIIEFTATPATKKQPSNVLHRVSAAELKAADMVKLPLRVITRHASQRDALLNEALTLRIDLEKLAVLESQMSGEHLRPILLIQAQRVDDCKDLKARLVSDFGIAEAEIKISVGSLDELKEVKDINAANCPVRIIITVEKLREGWDCPFAYVLCSLKETRSATAIEQIVGRILRLPGAKPKQHPDLNCAYAFSVSDSMPEVLNELRQALESNGFTTAEAERIVIPGGQSTLSLGVQPQTVTVDPKTELDATVAQVQTEALAGKVKIDVEKGEITVFVPLTKEESDMAESVVKTPEAKTKIRQAVQKVIEAEKAMGGTGAARVASGYEQQFDFIVPLLCVNEDGELFEFESTFLLEHPWKLSAKDATLPATYNPLKRPTGKLGVIDVNMKGKVEGAEVVREEPEDFIGTLHQQTLQLGGDSHWSLEALVAWIDARIEHEDIPMGESAEFLRKVVRGLMAQHGVQDVDTLALDRFRLRDEVESLIQSHRVHEREAAFKNWLLPESALSVSDERALNFKTSSYDPSWLYEGGHQFKKHYFGSKPGELREKKADGKLTEEFQCACYLDALPAVRWWVRNLSNKSSSFRLQTSQYWFYPDFICQLTDGRIMAVEYKGKHLWDDAEEKRAVGAVWEARSKGRCLFVMPTDGEFGVIAAKADGK